MILTNQGEGTLRDKNPLAMAVWLYLKLVPLQLPARSYAPCKRLLPGDGCLRESIFADCTFAP